MKKEIKEKVKKETKQKKVAVKKECPLIKESSLKGDDVVTKEILSGAIKEMVDLLKKMNNNHFLLSDEVKSIKKMISYDSEMTIKEQFADVHACISSVNKMREEFEDEQIRKNYIAKKELDKSAFILLSFIALNFGITIFLLINFFTVFDF